MSLCKPSTSVSSSSSPKHELVRSLQMNDGTPIQFQQGPHGWLELTMHPIAKACGKQIAKLKQNDTWKANVSMLAAELGVSDVSLFRSVKGGDTSDMPNGISVQGKDLFRLIIYQIGSFCHWELAVTFLTWCKKEYGFQAARLLTRLHVGDVSASEVQQIADDTSSLVTSFRGLNLTKQLKRNLVVV